MMTGTSIFISHNGCEPTGFDATKLVERLGAGLGCVSSPIEDAEIVVFLACTFTQQKENEFIEKIERLTESMAASLIVVSGCYLREYCQHPKVKFARTADVPKLVEEYLRRKASMPSGRTLPSLEQGNGSIPVVSISDGCYGDCSFCSIKSVRGTHRSRPLAEVIADIARASTHSDVVKLTGIETAGYGLDVRTSLAGLLREVFNSFPKIKIELGSLNPKLLCRFSDEDLCILAHENIVGNIHIPLQSASTSVLEVMRRGYTYKAYERLWSRLSEMGVRKFSTDLIAGFPIETPEDHRLSLRFLDTHDLEFAQVFFFEPRPGTKAADLPQLDRHIRVERALELIAQFAVNYMRAKSISPEEIIRGDVALPFNSNLDLGKEELIDERKALLGKTVG